MFCWIIDAPGLASELIELMPLSWNINCATMSTRDVLLHHFRKMLICMRGYMVAYSYLYVLMHASY